ncbi:MAG: hypothetical protein JWQ91_225 [Aeromicrobium sp.]|jgi:Mce-associated membrane protein|nr:hypothetical protein [Aeromicrobium sp.]
MRRPSLPRSRWSLQMLGALVVAASLVNVVLLVQGRSESSGNAARTAALEAAEARVPAMFSYRYVDLAADLAVAGSNTTGEFKTKYAKVLREVVLPNARKRKVSTQATVQAASVIRSTSSHAELLLFVNQATSTKTAEQPVTSATRIIVTMTKTSDGWFVSGLEPV